MAGREVRRHRLLSRIKRKTRMPYSGSPDWFSGGSAPFCRGNSRIYSLQEWACGVS